MKRISAKIITTLFLLLTTVYTNSQTLLFVGSYTQDKPDKGIVVFNFNPATGELTKLSQVDQIVNPSYLAISPNGKYLYACNDQFAGSITAFAIDAKKGSLTELNHKPSGGENPVYVAVDKSSRFLVTGNYSSGSVTLISLNIDGSLSPKSETIAFRDSSVNKTRQTSSHIHSTFFDPNFRLIFAPDLGADKIRAFTFRPDKKPHLQINENLTIRTTPGSGPRHFVFHPNRKFGYLVEELTGTISAYSFIFGKLSPIQSVFSYAKTRESYGAADIHISPDGKFLYASNRFIGENSISIFSISPNNGKLTLVDHQSTEGDHPRNFTIDPSGNFLLVANMYSNSIVVFKRNKTTGKLTKVYVEKSVTSPSCLQMRNY